MWATVPVHGDAWPPSVPQAPVPESWSIGWLPGPSLVARRTHDPPRVDA